MCGRLNQCRDLSTRRSRRKVNIGLDKIARCGARHKYRAALARMNDVRDAFATSCEGGNLKVHGLPPLRVAPFLTAG